MGKDNREWRKLVKKLRRSKIRTAKAIKETGSTNRVDTVKTIEVEEGDKVVGWNEDRLQNDDVVHCLEEAAWLEREHQSQLAFQMKQAELKKKEIARKAEENRIRSEWEETQRIEKERKEEEERIEEERRRKQVWTLDHLLSLILTQPRIINLDTGCFHSEMDKLNFIVSNLLGGGIRPIPKLPIGEEQEEQRCLYFNRTGACRFGDRCNRGHPRPTLSSTILVPNWFSHFGIDQGLNDADLSLECDNSDMEHAFLDFYEDVLPEFRKYGKVTQFKVCRNLEPHLRGNVYIRYNTIWEAVQAHRTFNARYYNGKQLSLEFVKIDSWNAALCGQFGRGRCPKGRSCNYLHTFRNPTREFVSADRDDLLDDIRSDKCKSPRHKRRSSSKISSKSRSKSKSKQSRSASKSQDIDSRRRERSSSSSSRSDRSSHSKSRSSSRSFGSPQSRHHSTSKTRHGSEEDRKFKKQKSHKDKRKKKHKDKNKKKNQKVSKKSKRTQVDEEAEETMSDSSIMVNTPSPPRQKHRCKLK